MDSYLANRWVGRLAKGSVTNLIGVGLRAVFLFAHSIVGVRLFGTYAYGLYAIGLSALAVSSLVGELGFSRTLTRYVAIYSANQERKKIIDLVFAALVLVLAFSILLSLGVFLFSARLADVFSDANLVNVFVIAALCIPLMTLSNIMVGYLMGFKNMQVKVIAQDILLPGLELLAMLFLKKAMGVDNLMLAYLMAAGVSFLFILFATLRISRKMDTALGGGNCGSPRI